MQPQHQNPVRSSQVIFAFCFGESFGETTTRRSIRRRVRRGIRRSDHAAALGTPSSGSRAAALLLRNCAVGLRALGLNCSAQLLHNSPVSRNLDALRALAQNRPASGPELQTLRSAASARRKAPGGFEAARSAPDWRPIPSLRSVITQAASRSRCALDEAPHRSRLGALPPLALAGARACFCRDRLSQRWGASFSLLRLGASHHGSPALGGLRKLLLGSKSFLPLLRRLGDCAHLCAGERAKVLALRKAHGAAGARPVNQTPNLDQTEPIVVHRASNVLNPPPKLDPTQFKARSNA
jgi:hypothetical protein